MEFFPQKFCGVPFYLKHWTTTPCTWYQEQMLGDGPFFFQWKNATVETWVGGKPNLPLNQAWECYDVTKKKQIGWQPMIEGHLLVSGRRNKVLI